MTLQDIGDIVHEDGGTLWRRKPGATSSFEEFLHSREHWLELFQDTDWNPWRKEELAPQMGRADQVDEEWERAEPDFRPLTERQVSARIAAIRRRVRVEGGKDEARWEREKARYDPERERARYALLEREAIQANLERELAGHRSGALFPTMSGDRRTKEILELEAKREQSAVGDREEVVDSDGKLPADRRRWNVIWYRHLWIEWVGELNESIAAQQLKIDGTRDRKEKSTLRVHLGSDQRRMETLLAIPRLEAVQMCADCCTPALQHTSGGDIYEMRPCPNWPTHASRMERVRETPAIGGRAEVTDGTGTAQAAAARDAARRAPDRRGHRETLGASSRASRRRGQEGPIEPLGDLARGRTRTVNPRRRIGREKRVRGPKSSPRLRGST